MFEADLVAATATSGYEYDVSTDGKRFLVNTNGVGASAALTVMVNCSAVLKK